MEFPLVVICRTDLYWKYHHFTAIIFDWGLRNVLKLLCSNSFRIVFLDREIPNETISARHKNIWINRLIKQNKKYEIRSNLPLNFKPQFFSLFSGIFSSFFPTGFILGISSSFYCNYTLIGVCEMYWNYFVVVVVVWLLSPEASPCMYDIKEIFVEYSRIFRADEMS